MADEKNGNGGWLGKFLSSSSITTVLVALIVQAIFSIVYQIINNEQQSAHIVANSLAIKNLRDDIVSLQTPLSQIVVRLESRVAGIETEIKRVDADQRGLHAAINQRINDMDNRGTRALELTTNTLGRVVATQDRYGERIALIDKRISDVENRAALLLQSQTDAIRRLEERIRARRPDAQDEHRLPYGAPP